MRALLVLLAACGRIDFAATADAQRSPDGAVVFSLDAAPDNGRTPSSRATLAGFCTGATCPTAVASPHGGANHFAVGDAIYVGDSALVGVAPYTVALWFELDSIRTATFVTKPVSDTSIANVFTLYVDGAGIPGYETVTAADALEMLPSTLGPVTAGAWHHVAATWDGTVKTLYVDGALAAATQPASIRDAENSIYLGSDVDNGVLHNPLGGALDEVTFYAHALAPDEIAALAAR